MFFAAKSPVASSHKLAQCNLENFGTSKSSKQAILKCGVCGAREGTWLEGVCHLYVGVNASFSRYPCGDNVCLEGGVVHKLAYTRSAAENTRGRTKGSRKLTRVRSVEWSSV